MDVSVIEQVVKRMLGTIMAPISVQKDGTVQSDGFRGLNFKGPGVQVTADPGAKRVNIDILGGTVAISSSTVLSAVGSGKVYDNGIAGTPPTNWQTNGFNDSGWASPVAQGGATIGAPPTGSAWITYSSGNKSLNQEFLHRISFAIGVGTISTASLQIGVDDILTEFYVNGTAVAVGTGGYQTISILPSLLTPNATNYLAFRIANRVNTTPISLAYRLELTIVATVSVPYVNVQDQKSSGTASGTFTSGAWQTRTLNTEVNDTGGIASLASNQVTLPAGDYECLISCPAGQVDFHQARLQNITAGTTLLTGTSEYAGNIAGGPRTRSWIAGRFTLAVSSALEVQHRCSLTKTSDGFGAAASFGTEVFTVAEFRKVS